MNVRPNTTLAADQSAGPPQVRALLGQFSPHGVELAEVGVEYDTRDNEIVTRRGMYHALHFRYSPSVGTWLPYPYELVDLTLRGYATPIPRWLTLSGRVVGDALMGSPPFYELARFNQTPAIGGVNAVRGIPAQRYYGKVKLFGNFEARTELFPFHIRKKPLVLGVAAFFDAGRVWTELGRRHPDLDGTGLGLKYGVGGGLRLQQGQTFVVRVDVAWSPDARPVGAYFAAGQIF
jgi:outer membrane protein assembly factor BamA